MSVITDSKKKSSAHVGTKNLIPMNKRTKEEQKEITTMGGKASGKARKRKKNLKQCFKTLKDLEPSEQEKEEISNVLGVPIDEIDSNEMVLAVSVYNQARKGNIKAFETFNQMVYGADATTKEELKLKKQEFKMKKELHDLEMEKYRLEQGETKDAYNGIPIRLIPPNFAEIDFDIIRHEHTEYVFTGGRGSIKSTNVGYNVIDRLMENEEVHALVVRKVANTLHDSVYQQITWCLEMLGLLDQFEFKKSPLEITRIKTGQKILFRGADDPVKIKSIKVPFGYIGVLWFEELDQFNGEEDIRSIEQSAIRGGDKAWIFKSFNPPKSAMNWANKYIKIPKENRLVHQSTYLTVPKEWLGKNWIDEAEHQREVNPVAYEHEYLGVANGTGGNVFDNLDIREITDDEIKSFDRVFNGVDWGWYPDPFAYVKCAYVASQQTLYVYKAYKCNKKSNEQTAKILREKMLVGQEIITCDSAEPKSIQDYKAYGLNARGAKKGPDSVEYSMKWLASRVKIVIDPTRCKDLAEEFVNYEYERDREGNVISGYPDKNNHFIDAVRYATEDYWKRRGQ